MALAFNKTWPLDLFEVVEKNDKYSPDGSLIVIDHL